MQEREPSVSGRTAWRTLRRRLTLCLFLTFTRHAAPHLQPPPAPTSTIATYWAATCDYQAAFNVSTIGVRHLAAGLHQVTARKARFCHLWWVAAAPAYAGRVALLHACPVCFRHARICWYWRPSALFAWHEFCARHAGCRTTCRAARRRTAGLARLPHRSVALWQQRGVIAVLFISRMFYTMPTWARRGAEDLPA